MSNFSISKIGESKVWKKTILEDKEIHIKYENKDPFAELSLLDNYKSHHHHHHHHLDKKIPHVSFIVEILAMMYIVAIIIINKEIILLIKIPVTLKNLAMYNQT